MKVYIVTTRYGVTEESDFIDGSDPLSSLDAFATRLEAEVVALEEVANYANEDETAVRTGDLWVIAGSYGTYYIEIHSVEVAF